MRHFNEHIVLGRYQCPKRIEPTFYDVIRTLTQARLPLYTLHTHTPHTHADIVYLAVFYEHFEICARFK